MFLQIYPVFGILGTGLITLGIIVSALRFKGRQGEHFSILNHFISELGEVGVSPAGLFFNLGLILGGLILIPYMIGLGFRFDSLLGWLGSLTGVIAVLGVVSVGIFPVNNLTAHIRAAMTYFRAGLVMVVFFALAIIFQSAKPGSIPQAANLFSLIAIIPYGSFVFISVRRRDQKPANTLEAQPEKERPRLSKFAMLEWVVFCSTILWMIGMVFFI